MTGISHCFALGEVFNADYVQAMRAVVARLERLKA
jgi:hypothetical protein